MPQLEQFEVLVLGSGTGGKLIAWHMAQLGRRTAVVERRWVGGSCPNIACMPSKNEISSARIAHLVRHGGPFGIQTWDAGKFEEITLKHWMATAPTYLLSNNMAGVSAGTLDKLRPG
jgi:pyruvate/2-oxoglutarate dehydrogenase complex dihydrolipoamide dehydrogenase (E3) component